MSLTVFMYHRVLPREHKEAVSVDMFRTQLKFLSSRYTFLSPEEMVGYISGKTKFPGGKKFAALTFDDGWVDNLLYATPVLKEFNLKALMAVSAGSVSPFEYVREQVDDDLLNRSMKDSQAAARNGDRASYLSMTELRHLVDTGCWNLAAHGTSHYLGEQMHSILSHPQSGESAEAFCDFLRQDLLNCKDLLSPLNGVLDNVFFWPWGHYSDPAVNTARELGYDIQFTVRKGTIRFADTRPILPRIGVSGNFRKLRKNCMEFGNPLFAWIHDCFHTEKLHFD